MSGGYQASGAVWLIALGIFLLFVIIAWGAAISGSKRTAATARQISVDRAVSAARWGERTGLCRAAWYRERGLGVPPAALAEERAGIAQLRTATRPPVTAPVTPPPTTFSWRPRVTQPPIKAADGPRDWVPPKPQMRCTPGQRDAVVERLQRAFAERVIDLELLESRLGKAFEAEFTSQLAALIADLPQ
jgi:hypothetical protein